jgi:hypothetical protein
MQQQDYIERMIAQITAAIGRILGLAESAKPDDAERDLASTWSSVMGLRRSDLERLDTATMRALLGEKRIAAAMLLEAEANLKRSQGHAEAAARLSSLATKLRA